jgi:hypothetical protein
LGLNLAISLSGQGTDLSLSRHSPLQDKSPEPVHLVRVDGVNGGMRARHHLRPPIGFAAEMP